jgi:hypothetical protein
VLRRFRACLKTLVRPKTEPGRRQELASHAAGYGGASVGQRFTIRDLLFSLTPARLARLAKQTECNGV